MAEAYRVFVVLDREYGERLFELARGGPVWIVDTPQNRAVAQSLWTSSPKLNHLEGVTTFKASQDCSNEETLINELDAIDLHHGSYSADPPYTVLEVIGARLSNKLENELSRFGFNQFHATTEGFGAVRPVASSRVSEYDVMKDDRLATIESEVRGFVQTEYPEIVVRAEYWTEDPSRIALFFIDERFRELYARQRYHYLVQLIPSDYYRSMLANTVWFELAPNERPETIEHPDQELISSIAPDVLSALQQKGFFAALDELLCPPSEQSEPQRCFGDFRYAKRTLQACGFEQSDSSDVFHVLMEQGAFCDCEILYNVAGESRLKTKYWRSSHHNPA
jgi:hypothetical protein